MTLEAYTNQVMSSIKVRLGEAYDVRSQIVRKNNGIELTGISIHQEGEKAAPVFYLNEYMDREPLCEEAAEITAQEITNKYMTYGTVPEIIKEMESDFYEFNKIKDKVRFKLINTKNNEALLKQIPSIPYMDLSIVFYRYMEEDNGGMMVAQIQKGHLDLWEVDVQVLYKVALQNMQRVMPAEIKSINEIIHNLRCTYGEEIEEDGKEPPFYVLSTVSGINGAACMLYPGMIANFAEQRGKDIIILPSSVHEVLLLEDTGEMDFVALMKLVKYINGTEVPMEDILSERVYEYNLEKKEIKVVA